VERGAKIVEQVFTKVLEVIEKGRDMDYFRKKILTYAITRVLPSISSAEEFAEDTNITLLNLIHMLNYYDGLLKLSIKEASLKPQRELI